MKTYLELKHLSHLDNVHIYIYIWLSYDRVFWEYAASLRSSFRAAEVWVAMRHCWVHTSAWIFSCEFAPYFQRTNEGMLLSFAKVLLTLIVHFEGIFTYCYHCFVYDWHFLHILQLFLIICNSSYICVSCVYNLKLCFFSNRAWFKQTLFSSFGVNDFKKPLKQ